MLHALRERQPRRKHGIGVQILDGGRLGMAPNAPVLLLAEPAQLLEDEVLGAVLLLCGGDGLELLGEGLAGGGAGAGRGGFGDDAHLLGGLAAGDAHDDLSHARVWDFGDLRRTVCEDAHAGEQRGRGAVVLVQGPGDGFIFGSGGDAGGEVVCEAGATDLADRGDVAAVLRAVNGPCVWGCRGGDTYAANAEYTRWCSSRAT